MTKETVRERAEELRGLTSAEAERSRQENGSNLLSRQKGKSFPRQFFTNLGDPVIRILLGALAVNLLLLFRGADWVETVGIAGAVFLATLISTLSEYGSAKAFERLSEASAHTVCRAVRDGRLCEIPVSDLVVGDLVRLSSGEQIPADGFLLRGELRVDQSAMTGEGKEVGKTPTGERSAVPSAPSALFRGCTVTSGGGEMTVTAVGDATFLGGISREIQAPQRDSPLKRRLAKLAGQISVLGYVAAALIALAYLFNVFVLDSGMRWELICLKLMSPDYVLSRLLHALTLGLTVIVVAVPEGLPMMIAVVLSSNIRRMVRDQVLVRKPVGIESAGSMNLLFTDKTGTLTEGKMRLSHVVFADGTRRKIPELMKRGGETAELIALQLRFAGEAQPGRDASSRLCALGGNATGRALLDSVLSYPAPTGITVASRLSFDSARKYSAVTLRGKTNVTFLTGAPEVLFPGVTSCLSEDGRTIPFSLPDAGRLLASLTRDGSRVLALTVSAGDLPAPSHGRGIRGDLIFLGFAVLRDPLRRTAADSVKKLRGAGIHVVMITGDGKETARAIAQECGILDGERDLILTAEELSRLSDLRVGELLPRLAVVSRALPTDKSRLVRISQEAGLVVGMTGDGINDAPALRSADVGFAMGSGTQVAKDAGDIVILDDNLASVVRAVLYGRNIFKSIRKFITLQLTMNFCAVGVTMICPFLGIDSPVTVVQMLWINLIMDTLGGLAFAGEPALPECMREKPKRREEGILNRYMVNEIALQGSFTVALFLFFLKSPRVTSAFRYSPDRIWLLTAFFALFIFSSVFNCFNARTDRLNLFAGLRKNPVFLLIMSAILVIQIAFIYLGGSVLRTAPLLFSELRLTMLLSLTVFPAELLRKLLWRLRGRREGY